MWGGLYRVIARCNGAIENVSTVLEPSSSDESNVTMTSGFSTVMLNQFSENGVDVLKTMTPWTMMKDSLEIF